MEHRVTRKSLQWPNPKSKILQNSRNVSIITIECNERYLCCFANCNVQSLLIVCMTDRRLWLLRHSIFAVPCAQCAIVAVALTSFAAFSLWQFLVYSQIIRFVYLRSIRALCMCNGVSWRCAVPCAERSAIIKFILQCDWHFWEASSLSPHYSELLIRQSVVCDRLPCVLWHFTRFFAYSHYQFRIFIRIYSLRLPLSAQIVIEMDAKCCGWPITFYQ